MRLKSADGQIDMSVEYQYTPCFSDSYQTISAIFGGKSELLTNRRTDGRIDIPSYTDARTHLQKGKRQEEEEQIKRKKKKKEGTDGQMSGRNIKHLRYELEQYRHVYRLLAFNRINLLQFLDAYSHL